MIAFDVRKMPCFLLSPESSDPKSTARRAAVATAALKAGLEDLRVVGNLYSPADAVYACAFGHGLVIERALADLRPFQPFLILEDDALPEGNAEGLAQEPPRTPDDADALYVGVCRYGAAMTGPQYTHVDHGVYYSRVAGADVYRVYNMLALHAVVIASERYARHYQRCAVEACARRVPVDVLVALAQPHFNVYSVRSPLFYQASALGGWERTSRLQLQGLELHGPEDLPSRRFAAQGPMSTAVDMAASLAIKRE